MTESTATEYQRWKQYALTLQGYGYQLIEGTPAFPGYAVMNASETPKPPMGDTRKLTLDQMEAWMTERSIPVRL